MIRARWPALVLCSVAAATGAAAGASPHASEYSTVFRDTTNENHDGPDITTVAASSDAHELRLRITVPTNRVITGDMRIRVWLDADDDRTTGLAVEGRAGIDHFVLVDPTRFRADEAVLYRCGDAACTPVPLSSLEFAYTGGGATFTLAARSLGLRRIERVAFSIELATGIAYDQATRRYDLTNWRADRAPDEGSWTFAARVLRASTFRTSPSQPRAGQRFALTLTAISTDTGARVTRGRVACSLRVAGRPVPAVSQRLVRGAATCAFAVPGAARGRPYRATISLTHRGATLARSVAGRVG